MPKLFNSMCDTANAIVDTFLIHNCKINSLVPEAPKMTSPPRNFFPCEVFAYIDNECENAPTSEPVSSFTQRCTKMLSQVALMFQVMQALHTLTRSYNCITTARPSFPVGTGNKIRRTYDSSARCLSTQATNEFVKSIRKFSIIRSKDPITEDSVIWWYAASVHNPTWFR